MQNKKIEKIEAQRKESNSIEWNNEANCLKYKISTVDHVSETLSPFSLYL